MENSIVRGNYKPGVLVAMGTVDPTMAKIACFA